MSPDDGRGDMPWDGPSRLTRLLWRVYFWLGDHLDDDEKGIGCACRWYHDPHDPRYSMDPDVECGYHLNRRPRA